MASLMVVLLAATAEGPAAAGDLPRRQVLGQVTDRTGAPLAGIEVQLIGCDEQFRCGDSGNPVRSDATGRYDISSTSRSERIFVAFRGEPFEEGVMGEYWDDVQLLNDARTVPFGNDGVARDVDAVLDPASYLTGRVTDETGAPLAGVTVTGWLRGDDFYSSRVSTTTSTDGTYRMRTTKGEHLIELDGDDDLTRDAWDGGATQEDATPVTLEAGSTVSVGDSILRRVGHITGTLREDGPSGRVAGCIVYAYRLTASGWTLDARASPDAAGRYSLPADQPVITGTALVGSTLQVSIGTWQTHDGLEVSPPIRYQWLAGDRPISGATGSSLTVTPALQGERLRVLVTAVGDPARYLSKTVTTAATRRVP